MYIVGGIVAYSIDNHQNQSLVNDTLNQLEIPKGCFLHSDQGSVYTSYEYYKICEEKVITRSIELTPITESKIKRIENRKWQERESRVTC